MTMRRRQEHLRHSPRWCTVRRREGRRGMDDTPPPAEEAILPLLEERLRIRKRVRQTGRVRVAVTTAEQRGGVEDPPPHRLVGGGRAPVGRAAAEPPPVREE